MAASTYRFLPWARRGLADRISGGDTGGPLPARATVDVGVTLAPLPAAHFTLSVNGPGDVIGVDPRIIVRTDPRAASTDVEPNYFAQVEFDAPDFPWLFTPAKSGNDNRLRPWLVLVVVDLTRVDEPRAGRGQPLPLLVIPRDVASTELPDLAESWAWAHTQALTPAGSVDLAAALAGQPALNVSRLVAPRRLEAGQRYAACLVPAFDAGVQRGLGDAPDPSKPLGPAWQLPASSDLRLPVYFHWTFATGPAGDFESLARRLQPFKASDAIGVEPMFIGEAGPELPTLPPGDPRALLAMDGALRAPQRGSASLGEVAADLQVALKEALDAAAEQASNGTTETTPVLGAPIYGAWHARVHTVPDAQPAWLRELNLDPRARAAAGLGGEIERRNQDAFVQWSWEQVGRILEANRLMSQARLSLEALVRVHTRHFATQPADRLLLLTAPLFGRTPTGNATLRAKVGASSLPDAFADPALRRLTSSQRPLLRAAVKRATAVSSSGAAARAAPRVRMVGRLGAGQLDVDPTRFVPHGLGALASLSSLSIPSSGDAAVDLSSIGLPISAPAGVLRELKGAAESAAKDSAPKLQARTDLRATGLLGTLHLDRTRELLDVAPSPWVGVSGTLGSVIGRAVANSNATALLLTLPTDAGSATPPSVDALDVDTGGLVLLRGREGRPSTVVAEVEQPALLTGTRNVGGMLAALPRGTLDRQRIAAERRTVPRIGIGTPPPVVVAPPLRPPVVVTPVPPPSITLPPVVRDSATITRLEAALVQAAPSGTIGTPPPQPAFVPFAVVEAATTLLGRTQPRAAIPKRLGSLLVAGDRQLLETPPDDLAVAPTLDRVLAYPEIDVPVYEYLAQLDAERFLPGVGSIPTDAITLLETNPRFTEALLVGLNVEMSRELLFRAFPTDQRGTPFRRFWAWSDGGVDIGPVHQFDATRPLGGNSRGGRSGQIALLVRGRLLRRYPNTSIFAWRAKNGALIDPPGAGDVKTPVFAGRLGADMAFVGFDLTDADLTDGDGWFFVLQQQPTEPRFGFDETASVNGGTWSDATWNDTGTAPGGWLRIAGNPLAGQRRGAARFVDDAGHLAVITLQKPMRVAVHAASLLLSETT